MTLPNKLSLIRIFLVPILVTLLLTKYCMPLALFIFLLAALTDWLDGYIARKSKQGREIKALERPGLWNGSMGFWNTIFVEVPLITFNPVKTVNHLLRPEHLPDDWVKDS